MSNNSTIISSIQNHGSQTLWFYITMFIQGLVIGVGNFFVVLIVLRFKELRESKEYLILMALSLADGIDMLGNITAGARRAYLVLVGEHGLPRTPWDCIMVSHNLIWMFSGPLSGIILFTIAVDRLLSVTVPLRYISWTINYVQALFGFTFMYTFITTVVVGLIFAYDVRDETENIKGPNACYGTFSMIKMNYYYVTYQQYVGVIFAMASVIVYGMVWLKYYRHQNTTGPKHGRMKKQQLGRQRNLTKNLGISCLCTIFLYMVPTAMAYIIVNRFLHVLSINVVYLLFTVVNFNQLANVFIYYKKQPEMKEAFTAFFTGKLMPLHLSQWEANSAAKNSRNRNQPQAQE